LWQYLIYIFFSVCLVCVDSCGEHFDYHFPWWRVAGGAVVKLEGWGIPPVFRIFCNFAGALPFALCPLPPCCCCCLNFNCVPGALARRWSTLVQALINYGPRRGWRSRGIVGAATAAGPACHLEKVNTTNALLQRGNNYHCQAAAAAETTIAITMTALRGRESLLEKPSRWQWQHQQHGREMAALQLPASKDYGLRATGRRVLVRHCNMFAVVAGFLFLRFSPRHRRPSLCHSGLFCGLKTNFRS